MKTEIANKVSEEIEEKIKKNWRDHDRTLDIDSNLSEFSIIMRNEHG